MNTIPNNRHEMNNAQSIRHKFINPCLQRPSFSGGSLFGMTYDDVLNATRDLRTTTTCQQLPLYEVGVVNRFDSQIDL